MTPLIVSSVLENKKSPVKNKDKYINLVYGEDLVNCLSNEIFNTKYSISRVTSKVDLKINSIYNFLKFLNETGQINKSLIDSKVSQYELDNNIPQLNKNFKESNIIEKLSTLKFFSFFKNLETDCLTEIKSFVFKSKKVTGKPLDIDLI